MYTYYILCIGNTQDIKIICVHSGEVKGKAVRYRKCDGRLCMKEKVKQ